MHHAWFVVLPFFLFAAACGRGRPPAGSPIAATDETAQDCGPPFRDADSELVSIAIADEHPDLHPALGEPLEAGRHYAAVDDHGFVGTLRAVATRRCLCEGCCTRPTWQARWIEPPTRRAEGTMIAFGPVNGRFVSARRSLRADTDARRESWTRAEGRAWQSLVHVDFEGEPSALDVRARECGDGASVIEAHALERGEWRLVSRTIVTPPIANEQLD